MGVTDDADVKWLSWDVSLYISGVPDRLHKDVRAPFFTMAVDLALACCAGEQMKRTVPVVVEGVVLSKDGLSKTKRSDETQS